MPVGGTAFVNVVINADDARTEASAQVPCTNEEATASVAFDAALASGNHDFIVSLFTGQPVEGYDALDVLTGQTVIRSDAGGGASPVNDRQGQSELPRTGAEDTGALVGGALLVLGSALVYLSRRRTREDM